MKPTRIPFSTEALRASLLRLEEEWETVQTSRERTAIYQYLAAVFETVMAWAKEEKPSTVHLGHCTSEDTIRLGSLNPLRL